jgi:DNA polymerase I-like protein with 3'-5' exonuclease and polymerase domains
MAGPPTGWPAGPRPFPARPTAAEAARAILLRSSAASPLLPSPLELAAAALSAAALSAAAPSAAAPRLPPPPPPPPPPRSPPPTPRSFPPKARPSGPLDPTVLAAWGLPRALVERYASRGITRLHAWQADCLSVPGVWLDYPPPHGQQSTAAAASAAAASPAPLLSRPHNLIYSAPTSGGKTLVAELLMLHRLFSEPARRPGFPGAEALPTASSSAPAPAAPALAARRMGAGGASSSVSSASAAASAAAARPPISRALVVLPFVALVEEKARWLEGMVDRLRDADGRTIRVAAVHGRTDVVGFSPSTRICVCTLEKANGVVNRMVRDGIFADLSVCVVDELHMVGDRSRGAPLEVLLTKLAYLSAARGAGAGAGAGAGEGRAAASAASAAAACPVSSSVQIIGMSATVSNLQQLADWLGARAFTTAHRPVPLQECVFVDGRVFLVRTTGGAGGGGGAGGAAIAAPALPSAAAAPPPPAPPAPPMTDLRAYPSRAVDRWVRSKSGPAASRDYDPLALYLLCKEVVAEGTAGGQCLVFGVSRALVEEIARGLAADFARDAAEAESRPAAAPAVVVGGSGGAAPRRLALDEARRELSKALALTSSGGASSSSSSFSSSSSSSSAARSLPALVLSGVAFHHSSLHSSERDLVEAAFARGTVSVLVATTTLAAGVNLPARRVLFAGPRLMGDAGPQPQIFDSTSYRQMSGRAGRTGMAGVGESIVLLPAAHMATQVLPRMLAPPGDVTSVLARLGTGVGTQVGAAAAPAAVLAPSSSAGAAPLPAPSPSPPPAGLCRLVLEALCLGLVSSADDLAAFACSSLFALQSGFADATALLCGPVLAHLRAQGAVRGDAAAGHLLANPLGHAAFASSFQPDDAVFIHDALERASRSFVMVTGIHAFYLVAPLDDAWGIANALLRPGSGGGGPDAPSAFARLVRGLPRSLVDAIWVLPEAVEVLESTGEWRSGFRYAVGRGGLVGGTTGGSTSAMAPSAAAAAGAGGGGGASSATTSASNVVASSTPPTLADPSDPILTAASSAASTTVSLALALARPGPTVVFTERNLRVHRRLALALVLVRLADGATPEALARRFGIQPGVIHGFRVAAVTMASMMATFAATMQWRHLAVLLADARDRLRAKEPRELTRLLRIPGMTLRRARALHDYGMATVADVVAGGVEAVRSALEAARPFVPRVKGGLVVGAAGKDGPARTSASAQAATAAPPPLDSDAATACELVQAATRAFEEGLAGVGGAAEGRSAAAGSAVGQEMAEVEEEAIEENEEAWLFDEEQGPGAVVDDDDDDDDNEGENALEAAKRADAAVDEAAEADDDGAASVASGGGASADAAEQMAEDGEDGQPRRASEEDVAVVADDHEDIASVPPPLILEPLVVERSAWGASPHASGTRVVVGAGGGGGGPSPTGPDAAGPALLSASLRSLSVSRRSFVVAAPISRAFAHVEVSSAQARPLAAVLGGSESDEEDGVNDDNMVAREGVGVGSASHGGVPSAAAAAASSAAASSASPSVTFRSGGGGSGSELSVSVLDGTGGLSAGNLVAVDYFAPAERVEAAGGEEAEEDVEVGGAGAPSSPGKRRAVGALPSAAPGAKRHAGDEAAAVIPAAAAADIDDDNDAATIPMEDEDDDEVEEPLPAPVDALFHTVFLSACERQRVLAVRPVYGPIPSYAFLPSGPRRTELQAGWAGLAAHGFLFPGTPADDPMAEAWLPGVAPHAAASGAAPRRCLAGLWVGWGAEAALRWYVPLPPPLPPSAGLASPQGPLPTSPARLGTPPPSAVSAGAKAAHLPHALLVRILRFVGFPGLDFATANAHRRGAVSDAAGAAAASAAHSLLPPPLPPTRTNRAAAVCRTWARAHADAYRSAWVETVPARWRALQQLLGRADQMVVAHDVAALLGELRARGLDVPTAELADPRVAHWLLDPDACTPETLPLPTLARLYVTAGALREARDEAHALGLVGLGTASGGSSRPERQHQGQRRTLTPPAPLPYLVLDPGLGVGEGAARLESALVGWGLAATMASSSSSTSSSSSSLSSALPHTHRHAGGRELAALWALTAVLGRRLRALRLDLPFRYIEMPLLRVVARMAHAGVALDVRAVRLGEAALRERSAGLEARAREAATGRDGWRSPDSAPFSLGCEEHVAAWLFDSLGAAEAVFAVARAEGRRFPHVRGQARHGLLKRRAWAAVLPVIARAAQVSAAAAAAAGAGGGGRGVPVDVDRRLARAAEAAELLREYRSLVAMPQRDCAPLLRAAAPERRRPAVEVLFGGGLRIHPLVETTSATGRVYFVAPALQVLPHAFDVPRSPRRSVWEEIGGGGGGGGARVVEAGLLAGEEALAAPPATLLVGGPGSSAAAAAAEPLHPCRIERVCRGLTLCDPPAVGDGGGAAGAGVSAAAASSSSSPSLASLWRMAGHAYTAEDERRIAQVIVCFDGGRRAAYPADRVFRLAREAVVAGQRPGVSAASSSSSSSAVHPPDLLPWSRPVRIALRSAIVAPPGFVLLSADYAQIEARLMAHMSGDPGLLAAFTTGLDFFDTLASSWGVAGAQGVALSGAGVPDPSLPSPRDMAKKVLYSMMYGAGEGFIANELGLPYEAAARLVRGFSQRFPVLARWARAVQAAARRDGVVTTYLGRRRVLGPGGGAGRGGPEGDLGALARKALNTVCQGSAADLFKLALGTVDAVLEDLARREQRREEAAEETGAGAGPQHRAPAELLHASTRLPVLRPGPARVVLQIHDELLLEVREDLVGEVAREVKAVLEAVAVDGDTPLRLPLQVKLRVGRAWGEMVEWRG